MKEIKQKSANFSRRNAINATTAVAMQDKAGETLVNIKAAAIMSDVDRQTGEIKDVAAIIDGDGICYTSISSVILDQMDDIIALLDDGETFDLAVISRKTKTANRDYLTLQIL